MQTFIRITSDTTNLRPGTVWRVLESRAGILRVTDPTGMATMHVPASATEEVGRRVFLRAAAPILRQWAAEATDTEQD